MKIHHVDVNPKDGEKKVRPSENSHDCGNTFCAFNLVCMFLLTFQLTMRDLLSWVHTNLIKERPEMFLKGDSV